MFKYFCCGAHNCNVESANGVLKKTKRKLKKLAQLTSGNTASSEDGLNLNAIKKEDCYVVEEDNDVTSDWGWFITFKDVEDTTGSSTKNGPRGKNDNRNSSNSSNNINSNNSNSNNQDDSDDGLTDNEKKNIRRTVSKDHIVLSQ